MPYARTSLRGEKRKLRERMRAAGLNCRQIATEFSRVYGLRPRAAWREACGWSLQEAADNINAFKNNTGLDPGGLSGMTPAHLCEYENWPGYGDTPAGRKPSPCLITVLAGIYDCQVTDLIDLADRRHLPKADLLIIDTCTPRPDSAISPAEYANAGGNSYVVLALPRGTQRIVIDVTGADAGEESAVPPPVRGYMLAGGQR